MTASGVLPSRRDCRENSHRHISAAKIHGRFGLLLCQIRTHQHGQQKMNCAVEVRNRRRWERFGKSFTCWQRSIAFLKMKLSWPQEHRFSPGATTTSFGFGG